MVRRKPSSPKKLETFFCLLSKESNFRNKQSMVQFLKSYQGIVGHRERAEKNYTYAYPAYISKTNLIFFYGRCRVVQYALFCRFFGKLLHHIKLKANEKS